MHVICICLVTNEICVGPQRDSDLLSGHRHRFNLLLLHLDLLLLHCLDSLAQVLGHANEACLEVAQLNFLDIEAKVVRAS